MQKSPQPPPSQQPSYPPPPQQQAYPPPPQQQPYPQPPPDYNQYANNSNYAEQQPNQPYGSSEEKIRPANGWKDIWATILWVLNVGAFIGVSVVCLRTFSGNQGMTGGGTTSATQYSGIVFDTSAFKIFGLAAVVGFGLSFLYLLLINA